MKQNVTVLMEKSSDGYFSCFVEDELPGFGLAGYGDTAELAKKDMMQAYADMKDILEEEGKEIPELEFTYKYDIQSFFNYFSFLNVTKIAELAGINPSLMRRYTSGVAVAGQKQYDKIKVAVDRVTQEMAAATF
ncbi:type II toxin-antitoxin system HicB family antitoxin [Bacteroides sp. UBA939]|uniref:type II toxin-antitoxin system HicB family antitoxin n=1 Tax=Bacteroides sp. UBA939 TaxID=1946092 RepID=UPI0025BBC943|nr:pilus assembly protein HicB [Bacteroides sp. UBA939]